MIIKAAVPPQSRAARMAAQRLALRAELWPHVSDAEVWNRKKEVGFVTIPRTLPLIMQIQDSLTKSMPVSGAYLDLWCRVFDEGFVRLDKPHEQALASGFTTQRGPGIWSSRLDLLEKHGFIALAPGAQGRRSFALIFNPYQVIQRKRSEIIPSFYNALVSQAMAIGAQGFASPSQEGSSALPSQRIASST